MTCWIAGFQDMALAAAANEVCPSAIRAKLECVRACCIFVSAGLELHLFHGTLANVHGNLTRRQGTGTRAALR